MQWRIINDRRPIMSWAADKLSQKAYVRSELERGGLNSVMRLPEVYWVGTDIRELQAIAHRLPARWALKPNHSSGRFKLFDTRVRPIDWDDLVKPSVNVITPNPKTSGGARWNYLAAWAYALKQYGSEAKAKEFITALYKNVPVLDTGARASTTTFAQRGIGDVFLSWENEAWLIQREFPGQTKIIIPSLSILAEPTVAVVDKNAEKNGTTEVAKSYLEYLYTPEAQDIIGKHYYRPRDPAAAAKYSARFPKLTLVTIDGDFGGWAKAQKKHFDEGGLFDQIYQPK